MANSSIVPALLWLSDSDTSRNSVTPISSVGFTRQSEYKCALLILCIDSTVDIAIWSTTEQGLGIAAGSLATLRPLFRKAAAHISTRSRSGQQGSSHLSNDIATIGKISKHKKSRHSTEMDTNIIVQHDIELESMQGDEHDAKRFSSKGMSRKQMSIWSSQERNNESEETLYISKP